MPSIDPPLMLSYFYHPIDSIGVERPLYHSAAVDLKGRFFSAQMRIDIQDI